MIERLLRRLLRRSLNSFAKEVVAIAKERGHISNDQAHELAAIIDRRLWPEIHGKDRSPW